jgi:hypothetical protein
MTTTGNAISTSNVSKQPQLKNRTSTNPRMATIVAPSQQAQLAAAYVEAGTAAANAVIGASLKTPLVPLQLPAQGDFTWSYTNGNNFNAATESYLTGAVTPSSSIPGAVQIGASGSFPNLYQQLINGIQWQLSAADQTALQSSITQSQTQATSVVSTFNAQYGAPTQADYDAANAAISPFPAFGPNSEIDYITNYVMGWMWAGKPAAGALSLSQMQTAQDLGALLPKAPASGQSTIMAVTAYLAALGAGARIQDQQSLGSWTIAQLRANLTPSSTNGGVQLFNGGSGFALAYDASPTVASILQQLQNPNSKATFSFSATESSSSSYNISFAGQAGISWGGWLLQGSVGTSWQGDIASVSGAGSSMTITMTYPGLTALPPVSIAPMGWNGNSQMAPGGQTTGWWYESILYQALQNFNAGAGAPTGFNFGTAVPGGIKLGANGTGYLSTIVVSAYPTISVSFSSGSFSQFSAWLATHTTMSVSLFGFIPLGSSTVNTYTATATAGASDSSFTLTLTPAPPGGTTIPVAQQTVPVLGVTATWAGLDPA